MSKKHTHGPIPRGNQPKYGIDPQKIETEEEEQSLEESVDSTTVPVDDVADEKGRIKLPTMPGTQHS